MSGFIEGTSRGQGTLFPERLDDLVAEIVKLAEAERVGTVAGTNYASLRGRGGRLRGARCRVHDHAAVLRRWLRELRRHLVHPCCSLV